MDSKNQNLELINVAIQKLMEERKLRKNSIDDDDQLLLSRLLSQLELLKGDGTIQQHKALNEVGETCMADREEEEIKSEIANQQGNSGSDIDKEEIVKELKKVKRQNSVTHWLLSIMIFLTVAWQVSEVSLLLKVKDGIDHPFKFLGGMFNGMLKGSGSDEEENQQNLIEAPSLPTLKIPELPNMELADLSNNHEQH